MVQKVEKAPSAVALKTEDGEPLMNPYVALKPHPELGDYFVGVRRVFGQQFFANSRTPSWVLLWGRGTVVSRQEVERLTGLSPTAEV